MDFKVGWAVFAIVCCASLRPGMCRAQTPSKQAQTAITWVFEMKPDSDVNPRGKVYLQIGARKVLVVPRASFAFSTVAPKEYKEKKIPARAVAACSGWWAGAGMDLYVVRDGARYVVYERDLDEQADTPPYKKVKIIPVS